MDSTSSDLTQGKVTPVMLRFALPMIAGNLMQQLYNLTDTFIVGHFLGASDLAAVGSSYTLMTFLTSILLGFCLGSGALFSIHYGAKDYPRLQQSVQTSLFLIGTVTLLIQATAFALLPQTIAILQVPDEVYIPMHSYLHTLYWGIGFCFLYNFCACLLRSLGNSATPLKFLSVSIAANILLDILFMVVFQWGISGAALATVLSQGLAATGLAVYCLNRRKQLLGTWNPLPYNSRITRNIFSYSTLTCLQQSVMNFGILLVQGLVNSFGTHVMAAFTIAVKIDTLAYMPVQDFGNAFSTFIAQNFGAGNNRRIRLGIRSALLTVGLFSLLISVLVYTCASPLMKLFISADETEILGIGIRYLHIEGSFYIGIGYLFLLYGLYRAICHPMMSVILTVISLGLRVLLAYLLSSLPSLGVEGIWWAIPIGWITADAVGWIYYRHLKKKQAL